MLLSWTITTVGTHLSPRVGQAWTQTMPKLHARTTLVYLLLTPGLSCSGRLSTAALHVCLLRLALLLPCAWGTEAHTENETFPPARGPPAAAAPLVSHHAPGLHSLLRGQPNLIIPSDPVGLTPDDVTSARDLQLSRQPFLVSRSQLETRVGGPRFLPRTPTLFGFS